MEKPLSSSEEAFTIIRKEESRAMRIIGRFIPAYLHSIVTTFGGKIYLPTQWDEWPEYTRYLILEHEKVHLRQQKKWTHTIYFILYFFCLPLFWNPFRRRWEQEAFEKTIEIAAARYGKGFVSTDEFRDFIARMFYTSTYGWMWPHKAAVYRWVDKCIRQALEAPTDPQIS